MIPRLLGSTYVHALRRRMSVLPWFLHPALSTVDLYAATPQPHGPRVYMSGDRVLIMSLCSTTMSIRNDTFICCHIRFSGTDYATRLSTSPLIIHHKYYYINVPGQKSHASEATSPPACLCALQIPNAWKRVSSTPTRCTLSRASTSRATQTTPVPKIHHV